MKWFDWVLFYCVFLGVLFYEILNLKGFFLGKNIILNWDRLVFNYVWWRDEEGRVVVIVFDGFDGF